MPDWKKTKRGETIEHEGATLHWCTHHVHLEGLWDGLYISHKSEDHDSWKEEKNKRYGKRENPKLTLFPLLHLASWIK